MIKNTRVKTKCRIVNLNGFPRAEMSRALRKYRLLLLLNCCFRLFSQRFGFARAIPAHVRENYSPSTCKTRRIVRCRLTPVVVACDTVSHEENIARAGIQAAGDERFRPFFANAPLTVRRSFPGTTVGTGVLLKKITDYRTTTTTTIAQGHTATTGGWIMICSLNGTQQLEPRCRCQWPVAGKWRRHGTRVPDAPSTPPPPPLRDFCNPRRVRRRPRRRRYAARRTVVPPR